MKLEQANRLYRTYKKHPDLNITAGTFTQVCEVFIETLKQVKEMVVKRDERIKDLKKEIRDLKKDRDFYKEIAYKGGE